MSLSKRTVEMLLDLVEIKISNMNVVDHEDARDLHTLESCRTELQALMLQKPVALGAASSRRRTGRASVAV